MLFAQEDSIDLYHKVLWDSIEIHHKPEVGQMGYHRSVPQRPIPHGVWSKAKRLSIAPQECVRRG